VRRPLRPLTHKTPLTAEAVPTGSSSAATVTRRIVPELTIKPAKTPVRPTASRRLLERWGADRLID